MKRDNALILRWLVLALVFATTALATFKLRAIFEVRGLSAEECLLLVLFATLFCWISASFWIACIGAYELWNRRPGTRSGPAAAFNEPGSSRTVLALPICNEDCGRVFAAITTMQQSLRAIGAVDRFDFFLLSDSHDPECRSAEQAAWRRLRSRASDARIFYRHRARNVGRKSGNIADFCVNWGALYDYMIVLDADSVMTGSTLVRLVELMDQHPRTALIQTAPQLIGGESLFARIQQFASWVYGPVYSAGMARLQGPDGNYWGHNAIIRLRAFMQHCGLPRLPGRPPLGGEIMSHDFVEAALLRRAGWDVWLLPDLSGSYEATPPNLIEHLKRDQRWCQGNLQHLRLVFAKGFRLQSRLHMAFGAISYLSSPLWLLLVIAFSLDSVLLERQPSVTFIGRFPVLTWPVPQASAFLSLAAATAALLYGPKLLSVALLLRNSELVRQYGGARSLLVSALAETVISALLAPVFMLSHSWFVLNILAGHTIGWGRQRRAGAGLGLGACVVAFAPHTVLAILAALLAWYAVPVSFWWFVPLLLGPGFAAILCWVTGDPKWADAQGWRGLFRVPFEAAELPMLDHLRHDADPA
jgi:membrane glycosyltransferase